VPADTETAGAGGRASRALVAAFDWDLGRLEARADTPSENMKRFLEALIAAWQTLDASLFEWRHETPEDHVRQTGFQRGLDDLAAAFGRLSGVQPAQNSASSDIAPLLQVFGVTPDQALWLEDANHISHGTDRAILTNALAHQSLDGLISRLKPQSGQAYSSPEIERLNQLDRLIVGAGEDGLEHLEKLSVLSDRLAPFAEAIQEGGDTARALSALTLTRAPLAGLLSRLAPRTGQSYSDTETQRLAQLDRLIVWAGEDGFDQLEKISVLYERLAPFADALREGGDTARALTALANTRAPLAGLMSRLAPRQGAGYNATEIQSLIDLDRWMVRGDRVLPLIAAVDNGGDSARALIALAEAGPKVAGFLSRVAPLAGESLSEAELSRLSALDVLLIKSGNNLGALQKLADVLGYPDEAVALLPRLVDGATMLDKASFLNVARIVDTAVTEENSRNALLAILNWPHPELFKLLKDLENFGQTDEGSAQNAVRLLDRTLRITRAEPVRGKVIRMIVGTDRKEPET
jgi:hypothetical protein